MIPAYRLELAGATPEEITVLQAEDPSVQERFVDVATGDIADWLNDLRETGYFADEPEDEPEKAKPEEKPEAKDKP